ncbi:MAG: hypothetical protein AAF138_10605 [Planctomycetota bacterium]
MRNSKVLAVLTTFVVALMLVSQPAPVKAQVYRVIDLGTLPGYEDAGEAFKVDDRGLVVGYSANAADERRRFVWLPNPEPGFAEGMHDGEDPDQRQAFRPETFGVNQSGQWIGTRVPSRDRPTRAYRWSMDNGFTWLQRLRPEAPSAAFDISTANVVVGAERKSSRADERELSPVRWRGDGSVTLLPFPPGVRSARADGVNDAGLIVGTGSAGGSDHSVFHAAISQRGRDEVGLMWRGAAVARLDDLLTQADANWRIETARDINSWGMIAGRGRNPAGELRAVLLIPVVGDFDGDDEHTPNDLSAFMSAHAAGLISADADGDGRVTPADSALFTQRWNGHQPEWTPLAWTKNGEETMAMLMIWGLNEFKAPQIGSVREMVERSRKANAAEAPGAESEQKRR